MTTSPSPAPAPIDIKQTIGPPIFIVGFGRSGTTLMRLMLSAHPRIYICHELAFYLVEANTKRAVTGDEIMNRYLRSFGWLGIDQPNLKARLPTPLPRRRVGLVFREIMREKAASYGKVRYGDKSPYHIAYIKRMLRDFPDARIINMVRDPRTNVASFSRMPFGSTRDEVNCLIYEIARMQAAPHRDRILQVRLEDLGSDPRREMERVLNFIGEEWDDRVLDHKRHIIDEGQMPPLSIFDSAREEVSTARVAPEAVNEERRRLIEVLCSRSMAAYGYQLSRPIGMLERIRAWVKVASALPEAWRFLVASSVFFSKFGQTTWDEAWEKYQQINPGWWDNHPVDRQRLEDWLSASQGKQEGN